MKDNFRLKSLVVSKEDAEKEILRCKEFFDKQIGVKAFICGSWIPIKDIRYNDRKERLEIYPERLTIACLGWTPAREFTYLVK